MPNMASGLAWARRLEDSKHAKIKNDKTKNLGFITVYFVKEFVFDFSNKGGLEDELYTKRIYKYRLKDFKFTLLGENLFLHPYKALYWEAPKILLLADLHLGKATHFRKSGIPIPEAIHAPDLSRLAFLINYYHPARIIILGDLFHSSLNSSWSIFKKFCDENLKVKPDLVLGNHDILDPEYYDFMNVHQERLTLDPFVLTHEPIDLTQINKYYNLCGHLHPSIKISGKAKQSLRVECFHFGKNHGILPAFGNFTGRGRVPGRLKGNKIFAIANQKVIRLF